MSRATDALVLVYHYLAKAGSLAWCYCWWKSGELLSSLCHSAQGLSSFPQAAAAMLQCCLLAMQTAIWPELSTCSSQRDSIYPAIVTSLACTHRIRVGAGFRLLPNLARVTKLSVQRQETTHADMQTRRQLSWAPHGGAVLRESMQEHSFRCKRLYKFGGLSGGAACLPAFITPGQHGPVSECGRYYVWDYCELRVHIYTPQVPPECRYATM